MTGKKKVLVKWIGIVKFYEVVALIVRIENDQGQKRRMTLSRCAYNIHNAWWLNLGLHKYNFHKYLTQFLSRKIFN